LFHAIAPPAGARSTHRVAIERGLSFRTIADRLQREGVIRSPFALRVAGRLAGCDRGVQAGTYQFAPGLSLVGVLEALRTGGLSGVRLTIPEGLTVPEAADLAERALPGQGIAYLAAARSPDLAGELGFPSGLGSRGDALEGYLFPDTYALAPSTTGGELVRLQVRTFWTVFDSARQARAAAVGLGVRQVVTLASIVEREARRNEERPRIAAVFLNRLARGMPLQADPTVRFAVGAWDRPLTTADLAVGSPWNTYRSAGLPPGPICSPGRASLDAVLHPTEGSRELYFVARGDGTHQFSATLEEHARARRRLRRAGATEKEKHG
jgi:UPF0755 protein